MKSQLLFWSRYHSTWQTTRQKRTAIVLSNFCFAIKYEKWKHYSVFTGVVIHFIKKVRLRHASVDKTLILSPLGQMFCLTEAPKQTEFGVLLCGNSSHQKPHQHTQSNQEPFEGTQPGALTGCESPLSLGRVSSRRRAQVNHNAT